MKKKMILEKQKKSWENCNNIGGKALEELTDGDIFIKLNDIYEKSKETIKTEAIVNRAYSDKISTDTISDKVKAQMQSINYSIAQINPKFKEGNKHYESTKELISTTMSNYKDVLTELSKFYDGKIEQLILRKVELESNYIAAILNDECLYQKVFRKSDLKSNSNVKMSLKDNIKLAIEKIKNRKKTHTQIDLNMVSKIMDGQDIAREITEKDKSKIEKINKKRKDNKELISKIEKEVSLINIEIARLNEQKKNSINEAMEVGDKNLSSTIRRPKLFKKITRFFVCKFNTAKFVETTIIEPLNSRIENFKINELTNMKG